MVKPFTKVQMLEPLDLTVVSYPSTATVAQRAHYDALGASANIVPTTNADAASRNVRSSTPSVYVSVSASQPTNSASILSHSIPLTSAVISPPITAYVSEHSDAQMSWAQEQELEDEQQVLANDHNADTLAHLEQERQILLLRLELQRLRGEVNCPMTSPRHSDRIQFKDVENAVPEFTGDNNYSIRKWISDFEDVYARFLYLAACKLLKGTAHIFMRNNAFADWPALRAALIRRFD